MVLDGRLSFFKAAIDTWWVIDTKCMLQAVFSNTTERS